MSSRYLLFFLAWAMVSSGPQAQDKLADNMGEQKLKERAAALWQTWQQKYRNDPEVLVQRSVLADRRSRTVDILAFATGIRQEPIEFYLVTEYGRDYEAVAITLARPSDIHKALVFIGLEPGRPVDYVKLHFWSKGDRVKGTILTSKKDKAGKTVPVEVAVEHTVWDGETGKPVAAKGLVFTGSRTTPAEDGGEPRYAADAGGEIAANFNDYYAVLDVPYRAPQGSVYGSRTPNPDATFELGQELTVRLEPMFRDGVDHVRDATVMVKYQADAKADTPFRFVVREDGHEQETTYDFEAFLAYLYERVKAQIDLFPQLAFDPEMPVEEGAEIAKLVKELADKDILKVEPNPDELYYQAFLPKESWLVPANRIVQPVELVIEGEGGFLQRYMESYDEGQVELHLAKKPFKTMDEAVRLLQEGGDDWDTDTLFIWLPPGTRYGRAKAVWERIRADFPVIYLLNGKPRPADAVKPEAGAPGTAPSGE